MAGRWAAELAAWRIDDDILAAAPESPYGFPPELFRADDAPSADTPSRQRALEALPPGGSVLDVGCGGGAASLALVPPAGRVVGVDESDDMLRLYAESAGARGVPHGEIAGRWPDVGARAPVVDVVVCHHVLYNVTELVGFARALTTHARRRVVTESTQTHPWAPIGPLWRHFHHQGRPAGPTTRLAAQVLREAGIPVQLECFTRSARSIERADLVAFTRRRLCLPPEREAEVDERLDEAPVFGRDVATLWWDV